MMFATCIVLTVIVGCAALAAFSVDKPKTGYASVAALIVCTILSVFQLLPSKPEPPTYKTISLTALSAHALYDTYINNIVRADHLYTNKHCLITGKVIGIDKNSRTNKVYVVLGLSYGKVFCYMQRDKLSPVIDLEKGNLISVEGICRGIDGSRTEINLIDCQIVNNKEEVKEAKVKIKEDTDE